MTLSAVAMAYPAQRAHQRKENMATSTKILAVVGNLALTGGGILLNVIAVGYGPISLATPLSVGSNLLSNMVLQSCLGIAKYTKNMIVGTLVLAVAVTILTGVGPGDVRPDSAVADLLTPASMLFLSALGFMMVACLCLMMSGAITENFELLLLYAVLGSSSTVTNTAIIKAVQMTMPHSVRFFLLVVYFLLSTLGLLAAALANGCLDDPSQYVPLSAGVQLVLTCIAGLCIWQDGCRLALPLCYAMVYVLIVMGSYLVSSFDTLGGARTIIAKEEVEIVRHIATRRPMGRTMSDTTLDAMRDSFPDPGALVEDHYRRRLSRLMDDPGSEESLRDQIRRCLKSGCKKRLSEDDLIELCLKLMEHADLTFQCDALRSWLAARTGPDLYHSHGCLLPRSNSSLSSSLCNLLDNCHISSSALP
jgi:hypothetical protein